MGPHKTLPHRPVFGCRTRDETISVRISRTNVLKFDHMPTHSHTNTHTQRHTHTQNGLNLMPLPGATQIVGPTVAEEITHKKHRRVQRSTGNECTKHPTIDRGGAGGRQIIQIGEPKTRDKRPHLRRPKSAHMRGGNHWTTKRSHCPMHTWGCSLLLLLHTLHVHHSSAHASALPVVVHFVTPSSQTRSLAPTQRHTRTHGRTDRRSPP